jgi:hypothetical protein
MRGVSSSGTRRVFARRGNQLNEKIVPFNACPSIGYAPATPQFNIVRHL